MVELKNVTKLFGNKCVLDDVCMKMNDGEITGIVGRNGSGKTVLLKCICGLYRPTDGEIVLKSFNEDMHKCIPVTIGAIIETPGFLPDVSGFKNLQYLASIHKIPKENIICAMNDVGLDSKNKQHVRHYSMGMRQRLGIAQAIMENPDILIFDEPTNGLDNKSVRDFHKIIRDFQSKKKTIIIASHNKDDIDELCDRIYEIDMGKIIKLRIKGGAK